MDEDLIVLGAQAETPAAGGETSDARVTEPVASVAEGAEAAAQPGTGEADPAAAPKPEAPKADSEDGGEEKPKKRSGINRMQDRIARLEAENASLRSAAPAASGDRSAAIEKEIGPAPKEADFDDYAAFEEAKADYRIAKALATQRLNDRDAQTATRRAEAKRAAADAFEERIEEAKEKLPDFARVTASLTPDRFEPHVLDLVIESEKGALLGYYFGKNPGELAKLNSMSERAAAKAVGALESRLTLAKPNRTPAAPAPAAPVAGAAAATPDPSKMSFDEYKAWRTRKG